MCVRSRLRAASCRWRCCSATCTTARRTGRPRGGGRCWSTPACRPPSRSASSTVSHLRFVTVCAATPQHACRACPWQPDPDDTCTVNPVRRQSGTPTACRGAADALTWCCLCSRAAAAAGAGCGGGGRRRGRGPVGRDDGARPAQGGRLHPAVHRRDRLRCGGLGADEAGCSARAHVGARFRRAGCKGPAAGVQAQQQGCASQRTVRSCHQLRGLCWQLGCRAAPFVPLCTDLIRIGSSECTRQWADKSTAQLSVISLRCRYLGRWVLMYQWMTHGIEMASPTAKQELGPMYSSQAVSKMTQSDSADVPDRGAHPTAACLINATSTISRQRRLIQPWHGLLRHRSAVGPWHSGPHGMPSGGVVALQAHQMPKHTVDRIYTYASTV
jgi:hypothetical protein